MNAQEKGNNYHSSGKDNEEQLIKIRKLDGTPYTLVKKTDEPEDKNTFIAIGDNRITEMMSEEECLFMIDMKEYDLLIKTMIYIAGKVYEDK